MKGFFLLVAAGFLLSACSSLPKVHPAGESSARVHRGCRDVFPKGKWQFVHSIEAVMPGGRGMFITGVAVVSSEKRSVRCVIMTLEGLAVFDAAWDGQLTVNRAIAPFDSRPFAEGMVEDIRLLFFHPSGTPVESGLLKGGASLCRYRDPGGGIVDVICKGDGHSEIRLYTRDSRLLRTVTMSPGKSLAPGVPRKIELTAHGSQGYRLIMSLVEAVPLE